MTSSPPRIALTIRDLSEGGAQKVTLLLARGFAEAGHPVDLVLWEDTGAFMSRLPPGVRLIPLKAHHTLQAVFRLFRYLKREKPAAMIAGLLKPNFATALAVRLARTGTRLAVTEHSHLPSYLQGKSPLAALLCRMAILASHGLAHHIVAVSAPAAQAVERALDYPRGRVNAIPNPVDLSTIDAAADTSPPHPWLTQREIPVIVSIGRLIPAKGMDALIQAFASVDIPSLLLILGEGPERQNLEKQIDTLNLRGRVQLVGHHARPYAFLHHAQAFALASRHESFGNVLVEALACGLPVVSTDCPVGPRAVLDDGAFGTLVPLDDMTALAEALKRALHQPREASLKQHAHNFSIAAATNAYRQLLFPEPRP